MRSYFFGCRLHRFCRLSGRCLFSARAGQHVFCAGRPCVSHARDGVAVAHWVRGLCRGPPCLEKPSIPPCSTRSAVVCATWSRPWARRFSPSLWAGNVGYVLRPQIYHDLPIIFPPNWNPVSVITARPGQCKHPCHRSCRTGVSAHRYRSLGERRRRPRLARVGGGDERRRASGGREVSVRRAAGGASAGGVSGASGDGGGGSAWAVRRSSSSTCGCRGRRRVRTAGPTCSPAWTSRVKRSPRAAIRRVADPEDGTMTLRFIVGRILRELIELAELAADAELVDALHDALDVAMPASSNGRCE